MKHITSIIVACLISIIMPITVYSQNEYQIPEEMPINNGELDWLTFKDQNGEIKLGKKELTLCSKKKSYFYSTYFPKPTMTYSKVPLNCNGDFYLSIKLKPNKIDEKTLFGLVINAASEADYNAIAFDNQFCYFVRVMCMNGAYLIQGKEDRVRYKYVKQDKDMWNIAVERRNGGDYIVTLNGIEVRTIPRTLEFMFPSIGVFADNKCEVKATHVAYAQWAAAPEKE